MRGDVRGENHPYDYIPKINRKRSLGVISSQMFLFQMFLIC